ncbi:MAG: hypothetical protein WEE36_01425 [Acidimicrobiia bacterium]
MAAVTPQGADRREPPGPRWSLTLVIAVVAITVGYLLGASGTPREAAPASSTTTSLGLISTSTTTTIGVTTSGVAPSRLADLVPGFEGTLVVQGGDFYSPNLSVWPAHLSSPSVGTVSRGSPFEFDSSSHLPARLVRGATEPDYSYSVLLVGSHPVRVLGSGGLLMSMGVAALDVRSFAWHSSEPRMLAWIEGPADSSTTEEVLALRVGSVGDDGVFVPSPPLATLPGPETPYGPLSLLAWDTWGFLISRFDEAGAASLSLLAPDGSTAWTLPLPVRLVGQVQVSNTGEILVASFPDRTAEELEITLTDLSGREPEVLYWGVSEVGPVRLSPDGRRVAYSSRDLDRGVSEVIVREVDGAVLLSVAVSDARLWEVEWTPDGRFVLFPDYGEPFGGRHVLVFIDTEDGRSHIVPFDDWPAFATVLMP